MKQLEGQRVLVVGGARNLGAAIARAAAEAGAEVVVGARDVRRAQEVAAGLPGAASGVRIDVADEESIRVAVASVGRIDHVVVTASAPHNVPVTEVERDGIVAAFDAKVIGPLLLAKHVAPLLPPTGSITLFSGVVAWKPAPGKVVMGVANGAASFLASHLARELAPVRVNAVSPGIVDSGAWDGLEAPARAGLFAGAAAGTLAGRVGTPDDVVATVLWLLGSGFVSGETIKVSGGAEHR